MSSKRIIEIFRKLLILQNEYEQTKSNKRF
jgi:hypothetical protein